jgi:hypothetical protein
MPGEADDTVPAAERPKRLIVVATGNVSGGMAVDVLPSQPLEDPSQSWNALTIGGFTRKEQAAGAAAGVAGRRSGQSPQPVQSWLTVAARRPDAD